MKLRRRRRVKAFPQKRSQLGGCGLLPAAWGCGALPRPERLAGQRLRRRPDKCDAGRRPSGRRIPRPAASGRTRSLRCTAFFPPKPLRWVSAGALLGEVIKLPCYIFYISVWREVSLTLRLLRMCRSNPARGLFRQKNGFLRVGALRRRTRCSLLHTVLFRHFCVGGWYHYPRRALHAVETLDAQELRRRIRRFYAAPEFVLCGLNLPSSGTHATPAPNRAHSGSHGETQGLLSPSATAWLCAVSEIATERTAGESGCTPYGVYPLSPASRPRWAAQFFCASAKPTRSVAIAFILWYDKLAS